MVVRYSQIANAGLLYCNGLNITYNGTTSITVSDGACRSSTNEIDMTIDTAGVGTVVATTYVGLNGLDTGTVGADQCYYVYMIADPLNYEPTGFLLSLLDAPYLPAGYGVYNRIGWVFSNASSQLYGFIQSGNGLQREYTYYTRNAVLTAGVATALTSVDLHKYVPPKKCMVNVNSAFTPNAASDTFTIAPNVSGTPATFVFAGQVASVAATNAFMMSATVTSTLPNFLYKVSTASAALTLYVSGFIDTL